MSEERPTAAYFSVIPWPVLSSQELSDKTKLVYGLIAGLTGDTGYCFATNGALAAIMRCGERTISRAISELTEAGELIVREVNTGDRVGNRERRIYTRETASRSLDRSGEAASFGEASLDKSGEAFFNRIDNISPNNPPISPQGESASLFARFWALYPRKQGKAAARKAWDKLKPDMELCRLMSKALHTQMASEEWQRDEGRYIPYPATWLNGRRWEDEPPAPKRSAARHEAPIREEDQWIT